MPHLIPLDVRGLSGSQPVLKVKALLDGGHTGLVAVTLDDEASAGQVAAFMQSAGLSAHTWRHEGEWLVLGAPEGAPEITAWRTTDGADAPETEDDIIELTTPVDAFPNERTERTPDHRPEPGPQSSPEETNAGPLETAVIMTSRFVGRGDDALGAKLTGAFFDTLAALGDPPPICVFLNSGVFLTTTDTPALPALKDLAEQGSVIISCGICLEYFGLMEQLKVGRVGSMYEIITAQKNAARVIRF